jgi:hypothetical protein
MGEIPKQDLVDSEWDFLIVLDACRFDVFEEVYQDYFSGDLSKKMSKGSATDEWLLENFSGKKLDLTYITANPKINRSNSVSGNCWNPSESFGRIVEVWKHKWDAEKGTVLPEDMADSIIPYSNSEERVIAHFIQPHAPFLGYEDKTSSIGELEKNESGKLFQLLIELGARFEKLVGKKASWQIRRFLGMKPINPFEQIWREYKAGEISEDEILDLYKHNLERALESISKIVDDLEGKIVITSDHGESLGEKDVWGHRLESNLPVLREVPWLEIEQ